jgi:hypothetical protein
MTNFAKNLIKRLTTFIFFAGQLILCINAAHVQAEENNREQTVSFWEEVRSTHQVQMGVDTWKLQKNLGEPGYFDNNSSLYLADSYPRGEYKNPSPWMKVDAEARLANKTFRFRYDRNQSVGSRFDELSMDWSHHRLGVRAGILGYKVSWCRTHDMDAPWMRENDPFCVARSTSTPIKSSPGIQAYVNSTINSFKVQSVAGVYRPLLFNYETEEFNVFTKPDPNLHVVENKKYGMSINAIDLENGLEMRLSYLRSEPQGNYVSTFAPTYRIDQNAVWRFAAISANLTPVVNVRLSYLNSSENADFTYPPGYVTPGDTYPEIFQTLNRKRISKVLELNYQYDARNVLSVAYLNYDSINQDRDAFFKTPAKTISYTQFRHINFNNTSTSVAWRRDWQQGVFTVVQYTYAALKQELDGNPGVTAIQYTQSTGRALGFRMGYTF